MSSKYYYLVAGLPELSLEDSKLSYTVADFKTEIYPGLSASDQKLIDLFYLKFDNANVLKLLKDKEAEIDKRGNYSAAELTEYISMLREGGEISPKEFPVYLSTFITDYLNTPAESTVLHEDHLATLYYEYAMKCGNKFVAAWFEFNLNINNILVAFTSRKFKWDIASNIVGNTEVCEALRTSSARDFGLSGEVDVFESLVKISEITELVEREKKLDALRWNWMDFCAKATIQLKSPPMCRRTVTIVGTRAAVFTARCICWWVRTPICNDTACVSQRCLSHPLACGSR